MRDTNHPARAPLAALLLVALLACSAPAGAAEITPADAERVTALTKEAQALRRAGRHAAAIAKLEAAIAIYPAPVLFYNLGRTKEDAGDLTGAVAAYDRCLAADPPRRVARLARRARADARERLAGRAPPAEPDTPDEPDAPDEPDEPDAPDEPDEPGGAGPDGVPSAAPDDDRPRYVRLGLTVSEGALMYEGEAYRSKVGLELTPSLDLGWFGVDLGLAAVVEPPVAVLLRPGVRFGVSVFYVRTALNFLLTPVTTSGMLFGVGAELPIGAGFRFVVELDVSLWFEAVNVVPIDGRLGVSYGF